MSRSLTEPVERPASALRPPGAQARGAPVPHVVRPSAGVTVRSPAALLALQRTVGNRAVARTLDAATGATGTTLLAPDAQVPAPSPEPPRQRAPAIRPVQRDVLGSALSGLASVAGGVRDRVLRSVAQMARRLPGYPLLCTAVGRDLVTGTPIPRTTATFVGGLLDLVPGSDRIRQPLEESGALERAGQWLDAAIPRLGLSAEVIRGLFTSAWESLGPADLLDPVGAFRRIAGVFGPPLARLRAFAGEAGGKLLELALESAMAMAGASGGRVMALLRRTGAAFGRIVADPVAFVGNLVASLRGGFTAFLGNIASHLQQGMIGWLTGSLGGVIRLPQRLDVPGVLRMALDLLGITWARVRGRLVRLVPEPVVSALESAAGLIMELRERGLAVITDRLSEFTSGLIETVVGGIRQWVANSIVGAAVTRILSMLNPAGAIVQAAVAIFNTVQFVIERAQQLSSLAGAVVDSLEAIAGGAIGGAVQAVERALGRAVPVVLGFLARLIGLGDVAGPVRGIMTRVHTMLDSAIDRVLGWIAGVARRAAAALGIGRRGERQQPAPAGLAPAVAAGQQLITRAGATRQSVEASLPTLRRQHRLRAASLQPGATPASFHIHLQREEAVTADATIGPGDKPGRHAQDPDGALLVGNVRRYRDNHSRQDRDHERFPSLRVYAEHVIPRFAMDALSRFLGAHGYPRQGSGYNDMATVLLYVSSKNAKDALDADAETVRDYVGEALVTGDVRDAQRRVRAALDELRDFYANATTRVATTDNTGAGGAARDTTALPVPFERSIRSAAEEQHGALVSNWMAALREAPTRAVDRIARRLSLLAGLSAPDPGRGSMQVFGLGLEGGVASARGELTYTDTGWTISIGREEQASGAISDDDERTVRSIHSAITHVRHAYAESEGSETNRYPSDYRDRVVEAYDAARRTDPDRRMNAHARAAVAAAGPAPSRAGAPAREPDLSTVIRWAREAGVETSSSRP